MINNPAFLTLLPGSKGSSAKDEAPQGSDQGSTGVVGGGAKKTKAGPSQPETEKSAAPKKMPIKMPKELWGLSPMKNGERIFQLSGKDGKCSKGLHTCVKCWKNGHGAMQRNQ